jgi:ribose 1,5-bisphosphokinase
MNSRLIYVVGPSGAGKDTLLSWLKSRVRTSSLLHWARRTIDRPPSTDSNAEQHESIDSIGFVNLRKEGAFAMHWEANSHRYGIRFQEIAPLYQFKWVIVNGSRGYLSKAASEYPGMTILHITADQELLRKRLIDRGRESNQLIEERIRREVPIITPPQSSLIEIINNGSLESVGSLLLQRLGELESTILITDPFPT